MSRRVVLFDFDGVLVRGDAFTTFVRARYLEAWPRAVALLSVSPLLAFLLAAAESAVLVDLDPHRLTRARATLGDRVRCVDWR